MRSYNKYVPGQRFGKLTLVERMPGGQKWRCVCDCGAEVITQIARGSRACYACAHKNTNLKHGHNRNHKPDRIYRIWIGIKSRCNNPHDTGFRYYGGRGISVCQEWENSFEEFHDWAIANGYESHLTIDRIDVNGNYEPANCRWADLKTQQSNKRKKHKPELNEYQRRKEDEKTAD